MVVRRIRRRLDDEHILAVAVLLDLNEDLVVAKRFTSARQRRIEDGPQSLAPAWFEFPASSFMGCRPQRDPWMCASYAADPAGGREGIRCSFNDGIADVKPATRIQPERDRRAVASVVAFVPVDAAPVAKGVSALG